MNVYVRTFVVGRPAPQGSKRALGPGLMVESSKHVAPWREDVRHAVARNYWAEPLTGPLFVDLEFVLPRPKSLALLAFPFANKRPDIDKLQRAVLDAIGSAQVWADDSQVVEIHARKRIARRDEHAGCYVAIADCTNPELGSVA